MAAAEAEQGGGLRRARWLGRVLSLLALLCALGGAVTARVIVSGEAEIAASTVALEAGDPHEAVVRSRRAAGWYAPGAPHVRVAYERLVALARAGEAHRRDDIALLAWRSVRTAAIETRWLVTPHQQDLQLANREIARIMAKQPGVADPDARIASEQLQKLLRGEPARLPWVLALVAGFVLAMVGLSLWSRQVAAAGGKLAWGKARSGTVLTLVGLALWLVSVWQA